MLKLERGGADDCLIRGRELVEKTGRQRARKQSGSQKNQ